MRNTLHYGDDTIEYVIGHNPALSSKIRIHVHPNGAVEVEAPVGKTRPEINTAVRKRARWITKKLRDASDSRVHALVREYTSGETHFYLGRRYQLKIIESASEPSGVVLKGAQIRITVRRADPAAVRRRLNIWYRERAEDYFERRLAGVASGITWLKRRPPLKLVTMRKQWGSCSPSGSINLNPGLIKAPRECIDYVIIHEICHLREHNHSKRYYELLEKYLPKWRRLKTQLDKMAELLLAA